jgi:hypothetical protein
MALEHEHRHFGQAIVCFIPSLWGKPRAAALLRSYIRPVQQIEDACFEVLGAFDVRTCDPTRLATLAKIVGQSNLGWSTETFRAVIMARIATNRSHGTEDHVLRVLRLITQSAAPISMRPLAPATLRIEMSESVGADRMIAVAFLLPKARGAGVQQHLLNPPPGAPATPGLTFASAISGGGGDLASAISGGGDASFSARIF